MKCGNCKDDHPTAAMVQMCYRRAGKLNAGAKTEQKLHNHELGFRPAAERREDNRRSIFRQIRAIGERLEAGGYAIYNRAGGENDISFYEVVRPTEGKWAGGTFVNRRASDEHLKLSAEEQLRVLTAIVADPMGAQLLFGQKLGICGVCSRTLTTKASRDRGIGPVCARNKGYYDTLAG
jgi:hypothetical protein